MNRILRKAFSIAVQGAKKLEEIVDESLRDDASVPPMPSPVQPVIQGEPAEDNPSFSIIPLEEHTVRTEVARQIEAAFAAIIWMEKGGDEVEVIVTRVYPVHIEDSNTYICMIGTGRKETMVEEVALPLHQFLQAFAPVDEIKFEEFREAGNDG